MTDKAQAVLRKIRQRQALKRLVNPETRERILNEFNVSTLDPVGPVEQSMRVLTEINDLGQEQEQIIRERVPKISML